MKTSFDEKIENFSVACLAILWPGALLVYGLLGVIGSIETFQDYPTTFKNLFVCVVSCVLYAGLILFGGGWLTFLIIAFIETHNKEQNYGKQN